MIGLVAATTVSAVPSFAANNVASKTLAPEATSSTVIKDITLHYAQLLAPANRQGTSIFMAIAGGRVDFEGPGPVFVTMSIGGQKYTSPTDQQGAFSFLTYANGSSSLDLNAWVAGDDSANTASIHSSMTAQ